MTNEKKLEVLEEALNYYQDRTSLTNEDEKKLQTFFNELKEAISVTRCCKELKDKKAMTFEEYIDNYYERKNFKYVNKRGKAFKSTEISQIYDEHIHNL